MQIEVGFYRTAYGEKAQVLFVVPNTIDVDLHQRVVGVLRGKIRTWQLPDRHNASYRGRCYIGRIGEGASNDDLIAPWVDLPTPLEMLKRILREVLLPTTEMARLVQQVIAANEEKPCTPTN